MKKILMFVLSALSLVPAATATRLPFVQDDYRGALSQAKQRHLPMFVEVWAPW